MVERVTVPDMMNAREARAQQAGRSRRAKDSPNGKTNGTQYHQPIRGQQL